MVTLILVELVAQWEALGGGLSCDGEKLWAFGEPSYF